MTDVQPRMKDSWGTCPCPHPACPREGQMRAKAWRSNGQTHIRRCTCRQCVGSRQKPNAYRREVKVGLGVGGRRNIGSGAFGGVDTVGGIVAVEETANVALVRGLFSWWYGKGVQAKVAQLLGISHQPRAFVASRNGKPELAVMPVEDLYALCDAAGPCPKCGASA